MVTTQWSETKSDNIAARSRNHCYRGKAIIITYSECASVALAIQYAKSIRRISLLSAASPVLQYFSTLSHNRHHIQETLLNININIKHKTCLFYFLYNFYLRHFSFPEEFGEISWMYTGLHVKYPLFFSVFNKTQTPDRFSRNTHIPNFMKIRPVEAELFRADGQTDKTDRHNEANSPFSQYYECTLKN